MAATAISTPTLPNRIAQPNPELKRRIEAAGLMRKRPGYYSLMLVTNTVGFGTCLWVIGLVHSAWATVLAAAVLGLISSQLGFQLHDSGHRQMFPSRRLNTLIARGPLSRDLDLSLVPGNPELPARGRRSSQTGARLRMSAFPV